MRTVLHTATRLGRHGRGDRAPLRLALGLLIAMALVVPPPLLAVPACALGFDVADCQRCQAKRQAPPKPASEPACHATQAETKESDCHDSDAQGECCRLESRTRATQPEIISAVSPPPDSRPVALPAEAVSAPASSHARARLAAGEPPGLGPPLLSRTTILRL